MQPHGHALCRNHNAAVSDRVCDEAVLAQLTEEGRKAYGNVLLDIAERNVSAMKSAFTTTFVTGESELKKRKI